MKPINVTKLNWKNTLTKVVHSTNKKLEPVLIIRRDDPVLSLKVSKFFMHKASIFVRLGVTCSVVNAISELAHRYSGSKSKGRNNTDTSINMILNNQQIIETPFYFVLDNCHHLKPNQLFYLLGLVMELEYRVQFWFLFTSSGLNKWKMKYLKDVRIEFFLRQLALRNETI